MYLQLPEGSQVTSRWNLGKLSDRLGDTSAVPGFDILEGTGCRRVLLSSFSESTLVRAGLSQPPVEASSEGSSSSSGGEDTSSQSGSRVVRAPLKRARTDDARTSRPTAEEVSPALGSGPILSPAPVSGPVPADSAQETGAPRNDIPLLPPEMVVATPTSAVPVLVSSGD